MKASSAALLCLIALAAISTIQAGSRLTPKFLSKADRHGWNLVSSEAMTVLEQPASVKIMVALKQRNLDVLEKLFYEISDPKSESYGHHLTLDDLKDLTAVPENTQAVKAWLMESGVPTKNIQPSINGEFIKVEIEKTLAEDIFQTNFFAFAGNGKVILRTPSYTMPDEIDAMVHHVSGLSDFFSAHRPTRVQSFPLPKADLLKFQATGSFPTGYTTPSVITDYYNITTSTVATNKATQSVFETLSQSFNPTDLTNFQKEMGVAVNAAAQVIGPNDPSACSSNPNNCGEANLDIQYIMGVAQNAPTTFWSIASSDTQPYLDFLYAVANSQSPPLVHSVSYGDIESEGNQANMKSFNTEAMKLGARGISIMIASGDDGVANFIARSDKSKCGFNPSFPASSPYVTAVGATQGPENKETEIACQSDKGGLITTGGGFSTVFDQPSYQSSSVKNYLNTAQLPPSGMFVETGRAYPDVAALGHNYIIEDGGSNIVVSGTSAASPVFASMVTLANGLRLAQGKSSLGFLNTALYQLAESNPEVFHDVTSGENNCCAGQTSPVCCQYGFYAAKGWDPVTGLGTPNYIKLSQALLNL